MPRQDQRFSTVATKLSQAPVLEDLQEFVDYIRIGIPGADSTNCCCIDHLVLYPALGTLGL